MCVIRIIIASYNENKLLSVLCSAAVYNVSVYIIEVSTSMADRRKLQGEIDRTLKKVQEGVEIFDDIWQKVLSAPNVNVKEKHEADLKKEIKKLQRLRDYIKVWLASSEIKDKRILLEQKKVIEVQMERFKVIERETKTKAYSKEGLGAAIKVDPKEKEKEDLTAWLSQCIDDLNMQVDQYECEIEMITGTKKKLDKDKQDQVDLLRTFLERHRNHIDKLETIMRLVDNDVLQFSQIVQIKEDVEYYINSSSDPDFENNEYLYDDLCLDELSEALGNKLAAMSNHDADDRLSDVSGSTDRDSGSISPVLSLTNAHPKDVSEDDSARPRLRSQSTDAQQPNGSFQNSLGNKGNRHHNSNAGTMNNSTSLINKVPKTSDYHPALSSSISAPMQELTVSSTLTLSNANYALAASSSSNNAMHNDNRSSCMSGDGRGEPNAVLATSTSIVSTSLIAVSTVSPQPQAIVSLLMMKRVQEDHALNSTTSVDSIQRLSTADGASGSAPGGSFGQNMSLKQLSQEAILGMKMMRSTAHQTNKPIESATSNVIAENGSSLIERSSFLTGVTSTSLIVQTESVKQQPTHDNVALTIPSAVMPPSSASSSNIAAVEEGGMTMMPSSSSSSSSSAMRAAPLLPLSPSEVDYRAASISGLSSQPVMLLPSPQPPPQPPSTTIRLHPLLGVTPLGPLPLDSSQKLQEEMLSAAMVHMPLPADSERTRSYFPRNPIPVPTYYSQIPSTLANSMEFFNKLEIETLLFIFYYMEGTKAQHLAAKALKLKSWRFHTKHLMWFQRHEQPKVITDDYEQGSYLVFDYEKWVQRQQDSFTFEYKFLEDQDLA